jgi:hypothetical protein
MIMAKDNPSTGGEQDEIHARFLARLLKQGAWRPPPGTGTFGTGPQAGMESFPEPDKPRKKDS